MNNDKIEVTGPTTLSSIIRRYVSYWRSIGFPENRLAEIYGDYYQALSSAEGRIPTGLTQQALAEISHFYQDPTIPFKTGLECSFPSLTAFGHLLLTCPTVRDILSITVQCQLMATMGYQSLMIEGENRTSFDVIVPSFSDFDTNQVEVTMGIIVSLFTDLVDAKKFNMCIQIKHDDPRLKQVGESLTGVSIEMNAKFNRIEFDTALLDEAISNADVEVFEISRAAIKRRVRSLQIDRYFPLLCESILVEYMGKGAAKIDFLANALQVNKRTVQLRLATQGLKFRDILKQARKQVLDKLILAGYNNNELAQQLEFTTNRSFNEFYQQAYSQPEQKIQTKPALV